MTITKIQSKNIGSLNLCIVIKMRVSYPKQDADSARHAHLSYANNCDFVPGGLSGAAGQRSDQFLHY